MKTLLSLALCLFVSASLFAQFNCCPDVQAEATVLGCNVEICFSSVSPKDPLCDGDITFLYSIKDSNGETVEFASTGNLCFLWTQGTPGETYTISGFVYYPWECKNESNEILETTFTIPENCDTNCCPDLVTNVTLDECDLTICFAPEYPEWGFCDPPFNSILVIISQNGNIVEAQSIEELCTTFTNAEPGATYVISSRVDYPGDCDTGGDVASATITIPEDCAEMCCPVIQPTIEFDGCDAIICFEPADPNEEFCELGFNNVIGRIRTLTGDVVDTYNVTDGCYTFTGGLPGETYQIRGRVDYPYECDGPNDFITTQFTIPDVYCCIEPYNFMCNVENGQMTLSWEGPEIVRSYMIEIQNSVEGIDCCDAEEFEAERDTFTLATSINVT